MDNIGTLAFYNVENFYSKNNDPSSTFLPSNYQKWIEKRYETKVNNIAQAISRIGFLETKTLPLLVGLAEVENNLVLDDLLESKYLKDYSYKYVLYESLDERKINVGCIYDSEKIKIISSEPIRIIFKNSLNEKSYTRDVLYLQSEISNQEVHFFIVHLPSKLDLEVNQLKRKIILDKIRNRIDLILQQNPKAYIVVMGDFNDTPNSDNLRLCLNTRAIVSEVDTQALYNPMSKLMSYKRGSLVHKKQWMLFDQILMSSQFLQNNAMLKYIKSDIFDDPFLSLNTAKHGAFPYRTFVGSKYLGGYSDHFPVFTIIKY